MTSTIKACAICLFGLFAAKSAAQENYSEGVKAGFKADISYLASDELEGREIGSAGERKAAAYIIERFNTIGLQAKGDSGTYVQSFEYSEVPVVSAKGNKLQIGRKTLRINEDYFPLTYSANGSVLSKVSKGLYGIVAPEKDYDDLDGREIDGRAVAISISSPDGIHPHSAYLDYHDLQKRVALLSKKGAAAVILYNDDATAEDPKSEMSQWVSQSDIPVVFLKGDLHLDLIVDNNPVVLQVNIERPKGTGTNVIGFLDKGKPQTVILGAHFDHLGLGKNGGSLFAGEGEIHNGADDNASGVAMMLRLAENLEKKETSTNFLFIGFSGEERGLFGSNYFSSNPSLELDSVAYMLNFDMVGRLDSANTLIINGVGTSPAWKVLEEIEKGTLEIKTTESGIGPSDHSSFYKKGIPAIHFFSGTHKNYHKPSDDEALINYDGMYRILGLVENLIVALDQKGKLQFTKTKESKRMGGAFTVTLGVIPDYLFEGKGMRIDGVNEDRPASNAGLLSGDVVIKLGDFEVHDMMSYMDALAKFKKGDATQVVVKRGAEEVRSEIQF